MKPTPSLRLPGLDRPLSRLVCGTSRMIGRGALRELDEAFAAGCTAFDTARVYPSEKIVGRWVEKTRCRDQVVLVTKGGHPGLVSGRNRLSAAAVTRDLERSLAALRSDWIDLYLLHRDAASADPRMLIETLERQRESGRIRLYGVSNWSHERIEVARRLAEEMGLGGFAASSPQYGPLRWVSAPPWRGAVSISGDSGGEARAWYRRTALPVLGWSPFASGYLSGNVSGAAARYDSPENRERVRRITRVADRRGASVTQIALAFLFTEGLELLPVVAARGSGHWRENWKSLEVELSRDELRFIVDLREPAPTP